MAAFDKPYNYNNYSSTLPNPGKETGLYANFDRLNTPGGVMSYDTRNAKEGVIMELIPEIQQCFAIFKELVDAIPEQLDLLDVVKRSVEQTKQYALGEDIIVTSTIARDVEDVLASPEAENIRQLMGQYHTIVANMADIVIQKIINRIDVPYSDGATKFVSGMISDALNKAYSKGEYEEFKKQLKSEMVIPIQSAIAKKAEENQERVLLNTNNEMVHEAEVKLDGEGYSTGPYA